MTPLTKILFLGMDAGDKHLIHKWSADGHLPVLNSLLAKGMVGDTVNIEGFFVGSTWPSFYTGTTPVHHGFNNLVRLKPDSYEFHRCDSDELTEREPFWNYLSQAGCKVAVLDIPLSPLPKYLHGMHLVEWGSHDAVYGFHSWPPELKGEVLSSFGPHPWSESCDTIGKTAEEICNFRDRLVQGVQRKTQLTLKYLKQGGWNFFGQVFTESQCVGHQCWHLHDKGHPGFDPETVAVAGNPILDIYKAIDTALGEILEEINQDTMVIFLASHGMSHMVGAQFLLPEILFRLQAAVPHPEIDRINKWDSFLANSWKSIPAPLKEKLLPLKNLVRRYLSTEPDHSSAIFFSRINPCKSKCFIVPNSLPITGLRINLIGREPDGIITPGREFNNFCDELAKDLLQIRDSATGIPIIKKITRTTDLYQGEFPDHLPDLLVYWNEDMYIGTNAIKNTQGSTLRVSSPKIKIVEGTNMYCRTGDHRPEGLMITVGPGIKSCKLTTPVSIMDFAPTFAGLLGVSIPDTDGTAIPEILKAAGMT